MKAKKTKRRIGILVLLLVVILVAFSVILIRGHKSDNNANELIALSYDGAITVDVADNVPGFTDDEIKRAENGCYEEYSDLDSLGRCGTAVACIGTETMPSEGETRTSLGSVMPSGWQTINFWCRCHLIGYQLSAENANEKNLITGTTRMNMSGMLPYENMVAAYIGNDPGRHVLYKVTPIYNGKELVARGVEMQAMSVEDRGRELAFNVYCFNYQPGYIIDYKNGNVEDDPEHQTVITIEDKKQAYSGAPAEIDEATVKGSTGGVRYIYYTDKGAKKKTDERTGAESSGSAPSRRGTYYVRAVVAGDEWYPTAASNVAKLTIY